MPFYLVTLPDSTIAAPRPNGYNTQVVYANSVADAKVAANALYSSDTNLVWDAATVTELAAPNTLEGVELRVVANNNVNAYARTYSFVGLANATLADLAEGMKVVLTADSTYLPTASTRSGLVITIPAGNNVGDLAITAGCYYNGVLVNVITVAVSAVGAEASARTITLTAGNMEGSRLQVTVADPTNPVDESVFLHAGETIDLAAARLVVLLNATTLLSNVSYASNVITIAGASDAQGAKVITATWTRNGAALPELAVTVNAAGASSIDRTLTLAADGVVPVPRIPRSLLAAKT